MTANSAAGMERAAHGAAADCRTVVAGIGNILLGDDGFGVEVARRLSGRALPPGVEVSDVGIRSVHLAFDLLDGCRLLILADASARGETPGTVTLLEVDPATPGPGGPDGDMAAFDAHGLGPDAVLGLLGSLGARVGRILAVVCEPADTEPGIGLSPPVAAAVDAAAELIERLVAELPAERR
ncbi:hydrogenase maturation protease [Actinocrinis puniceicyclus]|uniref:Hydrogenase maturation protease n=1 Tax=Actinocrinis puniceicyclus TaxID=977794 RepID=A0A8J7WKN4_9ACTN|nr:hydrogenase maturation protease [Actinocrinis puniceicyclus]MBS2961487.1 hydrogenase maturation protease [Actinocrinis puniceicyclus]